MRRNKSKFRSLIADAFSELRSRSKELLKDIGWDFSKRRRRTFLEPQPARAEPFVSNGRRAVSAADLVDMTVALRAGSDGYLAASYPVKPLPPSTSCARGPQNSSSNRDASR